MYQWPSQRLGGAGPNMCPWHGDVGTQRRGGAGTGPRPVAGGAGSLLAPEQLRGLFIASVDSPACTECSDLTFNNVINNNNN